MGLWSVGAYRVFRVRSGCPATPGATKIASPIVGGSGAGMAFRAQVDPEALTTACRANGVQATFSLLMSRPGKIMFLAFPLPFSVDDYMRMCVISYTKPSTS